MANKSKAKGTVAETKVVRFLGEHGIEAKRKALAGSNDEGDIEIVGYGISLEVKAGKQTANPNRSQIDEWMRQALVEGGNSNTVCFLCIVRYNRRLKDSDIYIASRIGRRHMYLDEFCDYIKLLNREGG